MHLECRVEEPSTASTADPCGAATAGTAMTYFITTCGWNWSRIRGRKATGCNKSALADSRSIASRVNDRQACKRKPVCVERISAEGGERDAGIFVGDDGGRGIARGHAGLRAGCYVVADA